MRRILLQNSVIAIALSLLFIVIYIWIRFFSISGLLAGIPALIALFHDVFVVFYAFVIFKIPLNDAFVAVILTIIGYSINDTIVAYDRIRENREENPGMSWTDQWMLFFCMHCRVLWAVWEKGKIKTKVLKIGEKENAKNKNHLYNGTSNG